MSHHVKDEIRAFPQKRYVERRHWMDGQKIISGCKDCGLWGPAEVLTFDHVKGEKKFNIGPSWNVGRAALEEEVAKCEVVCANCHAIRTKQRGKEKKSGVPPFVPFPKIARLSREVIITEKIDGTNASVWVDGDGDVWAASRTRWITPDDDNHGFAAWVEEHADEFRNLGQCMLSGEWWGAGVQRRYGLTEKRFSLFNTHRWYDPAVRPACCHVVPVLYRGLFTQRAVEDALWALTAAGSAAAPGFMDPEGVVVYHEASGALFKKTIKGDEEGKHAEAHPPKPKEPRKPKDPSKGGRRIAQFPYEGADRRKAMARAA